MRYNIKNIFVCILIATASFGQSVSDIVTLVQQGKFDQAQTALDQLEKTSRTKDSVLFLKGLIAKEADQALFFYQKLATTYPKSEYTQKAAFRIAQLKYAQGLYRSSFTIFQKIQDDNPKSVLLQESQYWAGLCCLAMNQQDSAIAHFGRVIAEFPKREVSRLASEELKSLNIQIPQSVNEDLPATQLELKTVEPSATETHPTTVQSETPSSATNATATHFSIQIGAFSHQNNALARKNFFESKGYHVDLRSKSVNGKTLYLVWVGDFLKETKARAFGQTLKNKYETRTTLVSEAR